MSAAVRRIGALALAAFLAGGAPTLVAQEGETSRSGDSASERDASRATKRPPRKGAPPLTIYVPPNPGAPKTRIAGTTRSGGTLPVVQWLAPDHTGHTERAQPTVWWWLSGPTDARIDLTVNDPDVVQPLLEVTLPGPFDAGYHSAALADHDVRLDENRDYEIFVAIVPDARRRSSDVVAGATIRRVAPGSAAPGDAITRARALAQKGIWFDAIDLLSAAAEGDEPARALRRGMLEAEGLALDAP